MAQLPKQPKITYSRLDKDGDIEFYNMVNAEEEGSPGWHSQRFVLDNGDIVTVTIKRD